MVAEQLRYDADFLVANASQAAGQIAWILDDPIGVAGLQGDHAASDDWFDRSERAGQSAVVPEIALPGDRWRSFFTTFQPIGEVPVEVPGARLISFDLYLAEGLKTP
jgi:hypothetical protein